MTIITLSNGKKVGNFSSPHPFIFEDGSILPAVSFEEAERLKVEFIETHLSKGDVMLDFEVSQDILDEMKKWMRLHATGQVDVVFCPLPMIHALKRRWDKDSLIYYPFRAIRIEDRIKKLVSIHKQCI
jgi:hypothetical protein